MKNFMFLVMLLFVSCSISFASVNTTSNSKNGEVAPPPKVETVKIKTSIVCDMCESKIKKALSTVKGVKTVEVNVDSKEVTVGFNPAKTNADAIRKSISMAGYDADAVEANKDAYNKLEGCCKTGSKCKK
jgi:copper chaperone CopZ